MSQKNFLFQAVGCSDGAVSLNSSSAASNTTGHKQNGSYSSFASARSLQPKISHSSAMLCSDDASSISSSSAASNTTGHKQNGSYSSFASARSLQSKILLSCSNGSLPPKKRSRLHFPTRYGMNESVQLSSSMTSIGTETSTLNSEWPETVAANARPQDKECRLLQLCNSNVIVPTRRARGRNVGNSCLKTPSNSTKRQLSNTSAESKTITDLDGNDMCMGYFSMTSRQSSSTEERISPAVKQQDADGRPSTAI